MKRVLAYLFICVCIILAAFCVKLAKADTTWPSKTFVLPSSVDTTYDAATYILLFNTETGDFVNASTGACTSSVAWSDADIATAAHSANTVTYTATIPALSKSIKYGLMVWSGTNYSSSDTYQLGAVFYDPESATCYTDTNPTDRRALKVRTTTGE